MPLQDFRIVFDRPGATYIAGETVTGKIVINLSSPKNVREIRLKARGKAKVYWTQSRSVSESNGRTYQTTDHYKNKEYYFNILKRLVGSENGEGQTTLPTGQHSYQFTFQLPVNIPCNFEHEYGHVRYVVKAILDRPWKFDHKIVSPFAVVVPHDLSTQPGLHMGIHDEFERKFLYCCFFSAGKINVNVRSRVSAFVPGETIELIINIDNKSSGVDVTDMKLKLVKYITFNSLSDSVKKIDYEVIQKFTKNGPYGKKAESLLKMEIPSLPPSNLQYCSMIDVDYELVLCIEFSRMHFDETRYYSIKILDTVPSWMNSHK